MNLIKEIDKLSKKTERVSSQIKQHRTKLTHWKGRRVIPLSEWQSILIFRREEIFNYLPDDFVPHPFAILFFEGDSNGYNDKNNSAAIIQRQERIRKWNKDYHELLEYTKNSCLGEQKCGRCLLSGADRNYDSMNIKDTIIRDLQRKLGKEEEEEEEEDNLTGDGCYSAGDENNNDDYNDNTNHILAMPRSRLTLPSLYSLEYPCTVANRFKCPCTNHKITNDDYLIRVGEMVHIVCDAIHHAHFLTGRYNDKTHCANFENGRVDVYDRYSGWYTVGTLESMLKDVKLSKVSVKTSEDVCRILTDEQLLRIVLDQYPHLNIFQEEVGEKVAKDFKELIIKFFMERRDIFTLQEVRDPTGRSLEESIRVYKFLESDRSSSASFIDQYDCICHVCHNRGANIQCLNCNVWICANHWRQHKIEEHRTQT